MSNDYLLKKRIRVAKIISTLLVGVPFVRCVVLNGSLAQGVSKKNSDIDFLVICKSGKIFTARFLSTFLVWLTALKRSSNESKYHGGKICLNYYLTDEYLIIPHNRKDDINRYCAENYSKSRFLAGDVELFEKFMKANDKWMKKYFQITSHKEQEINKSQTVVIARSSLNMQLNNLRIQQLFETLLSGNFGNRVESWLKRIQLDRINRDPRTKKYPDLIAANDKEMRFHPPKNCDIGSKRA